MESSKVLHKQYNNTINQLFNVLSTPIDVRKTINISMDMGALYICIHLYEEKWVVDENVYTNTVSTNFLPEIFS